MPLRQLYSVPVGLLLGVALALLLPAGAPYVAWLGQAFIALLKLLILPLILVSIYASLAGGDDLRRIGGHALGYYAATSAVAAALVSSLRQVKREGYSVRSIQEYLPDRGVWRPAGAAKG